MSSPSANGRVLTAITDLSDSHTLKVYKKHGGYEALDVLKLKDVVDSLEAAIDAFESVANTVEQIAVKES